MPLDDIRIPELYRYTPKNFLVECYSIETEIVTAQ